MITSKYILRVSEEWLKTVKVGGDLVGVYENPTSSDIPKICGPGHQNGARFMADAKAKKVYVWDSYLSMHDTIAKSLGLNVHSPSVLCGFCQIIGGKLTKSPDHLLPYPSFNDLPEFFRYNWHFMDQYLGSLISNSIDDERKRVMAKGWIK